MLYDIVHTEAFGHFRGANRSKMDALRATTFEERQRHWNEVRARVRLGQQILKENPPHNPTEIVYSGDRVIGVR